MIKIIWNKLGSLTLSFWLLISAAVLFIIGSIQTDINATVFKTINHVRIQDWMKQNLAGNWDAAWWLPLVIIVLFLLGVNTMICTINRIAELASKKNSSSAYRFLVSLLPSVIHLLFLVVMTGHVITITTGVWKRIPIEQDTVIRIDQAIPALTVKDIRNDLYPDTTLIAKRIRQTTITLEDGEGKTLNMKYLDSVGYHGYKLHLDMIKGKKSMLEELKENKMVIPESARICFKSDLFNTKNKPVDQQKKLFLLVISDPGLPVILTGFTLILIIMTWYFVEILRKRNNA
jgi:hypothetical protein